MRSTPETHAAFWPRGRKTISYQPVSPRLDSLQGKKVAFLWDYLFRGDEIFPMIEQGLTQRRLSLEELFLDTFQGRKRGVEYRI